MASYDFSFSDLNFNSVENLPGFETLTAFTVNSASVFREDVDIVPTVVDDTLSRILTVGSTYYTFLIMARYSVASGTTSTNPDAVQSELKNVSKRQRTSSN